jgi:hypothetical protein
LDLKRSSGVLLLCLGLAGCGGGGLNDHGTSRNGRLAACLERHGGERVQSIVVLDAHIDHWPERRFIRHVRTDPGRYATVILMPASRDPDSVLWDCQEEVAPGEAFP